MNVINSTQAQSLLARFRAGGDLSDEEIDALAGYIDQNTPDTPKRPEISADLTERGRHLRLALQYHKLLDELFADRA
ncbi:hypothetical protein HY626_03110 [Candidatus Uhrbacteria bacterium]|nr:hypothetical protein [Candidatus Uhrbacteria bacterium]